MKICSSCKIQKELKCFDFRIDRNKHRGQCNQCRSKKAKELRLNRKIENGATIIDSSNERVCSICKKTYSLSDNNFYKDSSRLHGLGYNCRICEKERNKKPDRLISSYMSADKKKGMVCDLTIDFVEDYIIGKECVYCGTKADIGIDRIDNSKGHTIDNSLPCCALCNRTRGDNFTVQEMKKIGKVIAEIRHNRV